MSSPLNPPVRRAWPRPQFSLKTLFWLMLIVGIAAVWWKDRQSLDQRIKKLEALYNPPLQSLWSAADILGPPDDPTGTAGKSWCPLTANGADWVEVGFDSLVQAATIEIYETYSVGCVTKVVAIDHYGTQTIIWKGTDPTPMSAPTGLLRLTVPKSLKPMKRVRIFVDSTNTGSWCCIDAVSLTTASGKSSWATAANCSSVYGNSGLTAQSPKTTWLPLW